MFTEFEFPPEFTTPEGLAPQRLRNLKQLVVLAGPNGAGKSRYLKLVGTIATKAHEALRAQQDSREVVRLATSGSQNAEPSENNAAAGGLFGAMLGMIPEVRKEIIKMEHHARLVKIRAGLSQSFKVVPLSYEVSAYASMVDPTDKRKRAEDAVNANTSGGFSNAWSSVHAYFHEVAQAMHDSEHPRTKNHAAVVQGLEDAKAFNQVLRALLSAEIEPDLNEKRRVIPRFRGRPFAPSELSAGELILAVWAVMLHRQREWLRDACVLIDEPENHLHPDVCIRALSALQNEILGPEGQIWLATHSVPLIAHVGMDSVYFVDNNSIEYAGNQIEKVISRLLGGDEGRSKLRTLMADADDLAFEVFAAQSLLPPTVASARDNDPQQKQMVDVTSVLGAEKENVRILDFAAGRGRLAASLRQAGLAANRKFTYYAFNDLRFSSEEDRRECLEHICQLDQPGEPAQYVVDALYKLTGPGMCSMDLVVLCNVLHEIPVEDWQRCFTGLFELMASDGKLILLEDQLPQIGELPHEKGYVILDELAVKELFNSSNAVTVLPSGLDGRLTAFAIDKAVLKQVTSLTIGKALDKVMRRAREQIRWIRETGKNGSTYKLGRKHAHFTLLYANAQLALEQYPVGG